MKRNIMMLFMILALCLTLALPAFATDSSKLIDDADILSRSEETELLEKLEDLSEQYDADFVIITMSTLDGYDIDYYAEYVYEELEYGRGRDNSGLMLFVAMEEREYWIYPEGECKETFSKSACDRIGSKIEVHLKDDEYADAFDAFVKACDAQYHFPLMRNAIICLVIGLVLALIVTGVMRGKLKTVRKQDTANSYTKPGSMRVTHSTDLFLYRNVTRVKKVQNSSSGSGSSNRGSGGKF